MTTHRAGATTSGSHSVTRLASASLIGTTIEWYDYFIFSSAAALVFNEVFFPVTTPLIGTLLALATFGAGFLARPVGAAFFGHFGDRYGRKITLVVTLVAMGVATTGVGLLPSYAQIGAAAPILLVALRLIQGLAVGGEWGGAVLIATEYAPPRRKALYGSFAQLGSPGGLLLASAIFTGVSALSSQSFFSTIGWRIPFLLSVVLIPVGLLVRLRIAETPEFQHAVHNRETHKAPILNVFRWQPLRLLIGVGAFSGTFVTYYLLTSFVLVYATDTLGMSDSIVLPANILAATVEAAFIIVGVLLAPRFSARRIAIASAIALLIWSFPAFAFMHTGSVGLIYLAISVAMIPVGTSYGVLASEVAELFTSAIRYTGSSLCYHFAGALGGLAPMAATGLLAAFDSPWTVAALSGGVAIVMSIACVALPRPGDSTESEKTGMAIGARG